MSERSVFITGSNGGIGRVLCTAFRLAGWGVIASDLSETSEADCDVYFPLDLARVCSDEKYREDRLRALERVLYNGKLNALINNAAVQIVSSVENLSVGSWRTSIDVNLLAPFILIQSLLPALERGVGSVINIGSIHAQLTKPYFTAYATSKAALVGLTRSLAVELGARVRINAICPAAIETSMLIAGFEHDKEGLSNLVEHHPTRCIGQPMDVARAALFLADCSSTFLNGAIIGVDGGVASRLHDPG